MNWLILSYLIGGLAALTFGGDLLVRGASRLASALGVPAVVIGLTVVAFGTSTPELAVSLRAAFKGNADISIANVVGSNTFNVLFILGVSALISPLLIHSQIIRRELPIMIGASLLLFLFSIGGKIVWWEALIFFVGIVCYTTWLVREALRNKKEDLEIRQESEKEFKNPKASITSSISLTVFGLGIVMLGAEFLVKGAIETAQFFGLSDRVIGLTIVAAGTSLPEVVASIMATIKGERDIAIGNVIGSNIYNILAILGLSGLIVPQGLAVSDSMIRLDIPIMIGVAALCWPFFRSGSRLSRLEGGVFLTAYIAYTLFLVLN